MVDSNYWMYHFWFVLVIPLSLLMALVSAPLGDVVATVVFSVLGVSTIIAGFGSFYGYYAEAQILADSDVGWEPKWGAYMVLHLLFTPFIVCPVYLFDRWRAIGIQWRDLKVV